MKRMEQYQYVIQIVIEQNVSQCKIRTCEQVKHEHEQVHIENIINGEIITDFYHEKIIVQVFHDERVHEQIK